MEQVDPPPKASETFLPALTDRTKRDSDWLRAKRDNEICVDRWRSMIDVKASHHHGFLKTLSLIRFLEDTRKRQMELFHLRSFYISMCVRILMILIFSIHCLENCERLILVVSLTMRRSKQRWFNTLIALHCNHCSILLTHILSNLRLLSETNRNLSREFNLLYWICDRNKVRLSMIQSSANCANQKLKSRCWNRRIESHCSKKPLHV